jgi:SAM-dependent methyltransferase
MTTDTPVDYVAVTRTQQAMWSTGDFHEIARQNIVMAEALCIAVDPHAGQHVLDVACGSGTAALVAGRRYCVVTGVDYVPELLERARSRASAEGFVVDFRVSDAQALPFEDASFDVVLSVYGVQFAPDQERAARELLRVCRPGGKIGLASAMPEGWSGDWFKTHARYTPPPPGVPSPLRWGTEVGIKELFGDRAAAIECESRPALQYFRSTAHAVEVLTTYFGPTRRVLGVIGDDEHAQREFLGELETIFARYNRATDGTAVVENTYLQTIVTRA